MRKLVIIFVLSLLFLSPVSVYAQKSVDEVELESINPDDGTAYKFKRLREKIGLFLRFSPESKVEYYEELVDRRLAELKYFAEQEDIAYIETVSQRYEAIAGELTELVVDKNLSDRKNSVISLLSDHKNVIEILITNYTFNNAQWRFVKNDINSLDLYLEQLSS